MTHSAFDVIVDALRSAGCTVIERGQRARAQCPVHGSRGLTLALHNTGGMTLLHCHAGCDYEAVMAAIGLAPRHVYDSPRNGPPPPAPKPAPAYEAFDADNAKAVLSHLIAMWGSKEQAGAAVAQWVAESVWRCARCHEQPKVGGTGWWRNFCADCITGWAGPEADADIRAAAAAQAAAAIRYARNEAKR